ncbi:Bacillopeptidase F [Phytophthora citrophthora]|uniref:subtilisin n=1 Tax=Phytophthora citrophthora TaxID=4793 RepID=A0AAD9LGA9_9STRA|nr:Bacillopeptidase F [Phytophthora citrophthora]
MARLGLALFVATMLVMSVSGAPQLGLLGGLLGTVLGTVNTVVTTLDSLVTKVVGYLFDPRKILIIMDGDVKAVIDSVADYSTDIWTREYRTDNLANIIDALKEHRDNTQDPILQILQAAGITFKSHWITNTIEILDCPVEILKQILQGVATGRLVKQVIYDLIIELDPIQTTADSANNTAAAGWGASKIQATNVWATGNTGQNVVVGTIDTGVRRTHEALVDNWVGAYGWYDPSQKTATPYDDNGHGTHTTATIAGKKGVGIAPGAKWMACKGCGPTSCSLSLLTACAQFMMCPTDTNGNNCNPAKAPDVVSNSWGVGQGLTYFQSSLDAWAAARIIPVFSAGNSGANGCGSVVSPGDSAKAFSVGASDSGDNLGPFSSLGPAANGLVKPDFTAPGVSVRSAWNGNNTDYMSVSGTSMAAPHLAGTIALALSARPGLCFDAVKSVLAGSTTKSLPSTSKTCGGTSSSTYPNNQYGYGRLNALNTVNAAAAY